MELHELWTTGNSDIDPKPSKRHWKESLPLRKGISKQVFRLRNGDYVCGHLLHLHAKETNKHLVDRHCPLGCRDEHGQRRPYTWIHTFLCALSGAFEMLTTRHNAACRELEKELLSGKPYPRQYDRRRTQNSGRTLWQVSPSPQHTCSVTHKAPNTQSDWGAQVGSASSQPIPGMSPPQEFAFIHPASTQTSTHPVSAILAKRNLHLDPIGPEAKRRKQTHTAGIHQIQYLVQWEGVDANGRPHPME